MKKYYSQLVSLMLLGSIAAPINSLEAGKRTGESSGIAKLNKTQKKQVSLSVSGKAPVIGGFLVKKQNPSGAVIHSKMQLRKSAQNIPASQISKTEAQDSFGRLKNIWEELGTLLDRIAQRIDLIKSKRQDRDYERSKYLRECGLSLEGQHARLIGKDDEQNSRDLMCLMDKHKALVNKLSGEIQGSRPDEIPYSEEELINMGKLARKQAENFKKKYNCNLSVDGLLASISAVLGSSEQTIADEEESQQNSVAKQEKHHRKHHHKSKKGSSANDESSSDNSTDPQDRD